MLSELDISERHKKIQAPDHDKLDLSLSTILSPPKFSGTSTHQTSSHGLHGQHILSAMNFTKSQV